MLNETMIIPEYKYSDKIDYTKPIPPHLLYEEENGLSKKRTNHLKNLAQTCLKYSQEFDIILTSIPTSPITSFLVPSPDQNMQEELTCDEFQINQKSRLLSDQDRETEIRPNLKRKKKSKKLKKLSTKLNKRYESTPNEEENLESSQERKELLQIKTFSNNINNSNTLVNLPLIQNKIVNEKKAQRFSPYEKQKLPSLETASVQHKELMKANSQHRTCPWLVNGKICGRQFSTDDSFNDHIKNHTTESILTDLNFYYQAKNLLNPKGFREVC